jgi:GlpG protein
MRRIGFIDNPSDAERLCDFLLTREIRATPEPEGEGSPRMAIWVKDENRLAEARELYTAFLANPRDPRYDVGQQAKAILAREEATQAKRMAKIRKGIEASGAGLSGGRRTPVTVAAIVLCVLVGVLTGFGRPRPKIDANGLPQMSSELRIYYALTFVGVRDLPRSGPQRSDPFASVRKGEVWRFLTPALLHANIGHLAMNMMGLFFMGSVFERIHGGRWLALSLILMAVVSMAVQVFWPASNNGGPSAVGASGAIYGLFGFFMMRVYFDPTYPVQLPPMFQVMGLGFLILGVLMVIPDIANGSHVGGLAAGMVLAALIPVGSRPGKGWLGRWGGRKWG